ncbi:MAG: DNA-processing protein DprA [Rhodospirillaceae bacterium]|nr:DNA-processing protein DprA [Rhodospirillaceae bacterium]MDE0617988.1 DNA-processing protein DprA [Rhodospirillaceae bacterium]
MSDEERIAWLRLIRSENVGPVTFWHLLRHFGSAADALDALPDLSRRGGRSKPVRIASVAAAEAEIAATRKAGARLVAAQEPDYPWRLATTEDAPPLISLAGVAALGNAPVVSIVGARNASSNGKRIARTIAQGLGEAGVAVASGLARGIDAAAHAGSLETGTIAVVAGGIDVCYPPEHEELMQDIAGRGAILAEQPVGTKPQGRHFPRRNRIVSGIASGVLVVEAAARSGSLITARCAGEQGRDVFAVPGSPLDPRCTGANGLLRDGAILTESADDVLQVLQPGLRDAPGASEPTALPPDTAEEAPRAAVDAVVVDARHSLADHLSPAPTPIDDLVREFGDDSATVAAALLELELAGRIERYPGNRVALVAA